jgi:hypothetical protein
VKDQRVYLLHAIDAVDAILRYTAEGRDAAAARQVEPAVDRRRGLAQTPDVRPHLTRMPVALELLPPLWRVSRPPAAERALLATPERRSLGGLQTAFGGGPFEGLVECGDRIGPAHMRRVQHATVGHP